MFGPRDNSPRAPRPKGEAYERHKERASRRQRKLSRDSREISGDFPEIENPQRRKKGLAKARVFCTTYFPGVFSIEFSKDHLVILEKAEKAIREGGQFALAMPRGSGKTAICVALCLWAIFNGYHEVVMLIGSTQQGAIELLEGIKTQLSTNDLLLADFPEICYPIRRLGGVNQRRLLYQGELIRQNSTKAQLNFPSLPPNPAASACIVVRGITGRIRGFKLTRPDGREVRPSIAIIDDPQTDKSAKSPAQCATRERIVNGTVLGLAGPDKSIAAIMPCTVIFPDDMADRMLDREKNPQWRGERTKMIYAWPSGKETERRLEEYTLLWKRVNAEGLDNEVLNRFWRRHRKQLERGADVAWPQRKYPDTVSAVQHAYNLRLKMGREAFDAEFQNDPPRMDSQEGKRLEPEEIFAKVNRLPRGIVPATSSYLTAFIDCQDKVLFWVVCGWSDDFSGAIVDYGCYPDQGRMYFTKSDIKRCYADELPDAGEEAQLYRALTNLTKQLLGREWTRDGGTTVATIDRCLIDYGWKGDTVFEFCRQTEFRSIVMPSKGFGVGAKQRPFGDYKPRPGEVSRENYRISTNATKRAIKSTLIETNAWKSFVEQRIKTPLGARGSLSVFGDGPEVHRLFADHLTAEERVRIQAKGRTVDEWQEPGPGRDNDWWDCVVGCAVGASMLGAQLLAIPSATVSTGMRWSELRARKAGV